MAHLLGAGLDSGPDPLLVSLGRHYLGLQWDLSCLMLSRTRTVPLSRKVQFQIFLFILKTLLSFCCPLSFNQSVLPVPFLMLRSVLCKEH